MTETTPPASLPEEPEQAAAATQDDDVEGHLYGEYYNPQVAGRFGRPSAARPTDAPPRRTSRLGRRKGGDGVG
jgi:hypothetical protein